jgi:cytochrome c556
MTRRRRLWTALVLGVAALAVTGIAIAQMAHVGSGDIIADRQRLMKLNGASWRDAQDKLKAGNIEAIVVNAETMAINAQHIPTLFPQGSMSDKSNAKPEIWEKRSEFESAAKNFETWSIKLRDAARNKNGDEVQAIAKDFGRNACGTCHTPFRVPPKS